VTPNPPALAALLAAGRGPGRLAAAVLSRPRASPTPICFPRIRPRHAE